MIPAMVPNSYIVHVLDIETNFIVYHNPDGWNKAIEVLEIQYPEPPEDSKPLPPLGFAADPNIHPQCNAQANDPVENDRSLNGTWTKFI